MYEVALDEAWELFDEHLDGARSALVCVASGNGSSERSRAALNSAMASLGYGSGACTFAAVEGLDDQALFLRVEGLDPICLIATDSTAAAALGRAYRCEVEFRDFDAMLDDGQDKQIAWALLKKLPRFGE